MTNNTLLITALDNALKVVNDMMENMGDCPYKERVREIGLHLVVAGVAIDPRVPDEYELAVDGERLVKAVSDNTNYELEPVRDIIQEACRLLHISYEED